MKRLGMVLLVAALAMAQELTIERNDLNLPGESEWAFPRFLPNGEELLLSSPGYHGLWRYNLENGQVTEITENEGAGYQVLAIDKDQLLLRLTLRHSPHRVAPLQYQIFLLDLRDGSMIPRSEKGRDIQLISGHSGYVIQNGKTAEQFLFTTQSEGWMITDTKTDAIRIGRGSEERILQPKGEGHYLWASLSPTADEILFTYAGKGSYFCDLHGTLTDSLGFLNAPSYSPDGKYITGMVDEDDGHVITKSELWLIERENLNRHQLTDTPQIHEMYPQFNQDASRIAFHTADGKIGILEMSWEGGEQ